METTMMVVAVGAIVLAVVLFIVKQLQRSAKPQESAGFAAMGVPGVKPKGPPPPMPQEKRQWKTKKMQNKRGWKAPAGHHFDDDDELVTDLGSSIVDMAIIAQLCGERYEVSEPVGTETIASHPEPIPIQTKDTGTPESVGIVHGGGCESHSESHSYSGGDSGGGDSGGGDCGGDD